MSPLTEPTKLTLRKSWQPMDADAAAYITAVEAADTAAGQSGGLEEKTKIAIDNFVLGCKADGIWTAIKASCILAGARTLAGALVPLAGTAPTNNNFVSGDYNRKTGLVGDGSTKYLDSNRNNNADPQNSIHLAANTTTLSGDLISFESQSNLLGSGTRLRTSTFTGYTAVSGFLGVSRQDAAGYARRYNKTSDFVSATSASPGNGNLFVLARNNSGTPVNFSVSRITFYSIGESLDLTKLDARVTDLINAFGAAIP